MSLMAGQSVAVLDTETTGFDPTQGHGLIEVACVLVDDGLIGQTWTSLVKPGRPIPPDATAVHGITDAMVSGAPAPAELAPRLIEATRDRTLAFHNAAFDLPFLAAMMRAAARGPLLNPVLDTLGLARGLFGSGGNSLSALARRLGLPPEPAHRALGDALTTARALLLLAERWERERGVRSLLELAATSQDVLRLAARRSGGPPGPARDAALTGSAPPR
jgi:DNA polymerase III epsilon subunit family exonuclease